MLITQDLSQHHGVYGKEESITANRHVGIAFAANKPETAELLSQVPADGRKEPPYLVDDALRPAQVKHETQ
jgi:hypothetical protein